MYVNYGDDDNNGEIGGGGMVQKEDFAHGGLPT